MLPSVILTSELDVTGLETRRASPDISGLALRIIPDFPGLFLRVLTTGLAIAWRHYVNTIACLKVDIPDSLSRKHSLGRGRNQVQLLGIEMEDLVQNPVAVQVLRRFADSHIACPCENQGRPLNSAVPFSSMVASVRVTLAGATFRKYYVVRLNFLLSRVRSCQSFRMGL